MMKKRRRVLKQRKKTTREDLRLKKLKEVKRLANKANRRLNSLERKYKSGTWASRKLRDRTKTKRFKAWSEIGRIKVKKSFNVTDLMLLEKAIKQFLKSSTSTKVGISEAKERVKESIKNTLNETGFELTDQEADIFYSMLEDNDFNYFADKVGASTMWAIMDDAIEYNESETKFVNRIERYIVTINDLDTLDKVKRLYDKYIRK